ncbi:DUF7241 domain-containing protein [Tautonia plasticadhaerens]|uniref:DUF7241 domain-containing protein n=1 Tax=Tautonia plasticadhaerens TaxID=2527974 RepID=A0A518H3Q0_9BACT|nr:hypothetical protein [Tautonia plasticadhaerens]QDV35481.1 hypothetical protein ElP_33840 [Tautonia plasticadhaerens]
MTTPTSTPPPRPTSADLCRARDWGVGTVLEGRESLPGASWWAEDRIRITAVGEEGVLARTIARRSHDAPEWTPVDRGESSWSLEDRDWRVVDPENQQP